MMDKLKGALERLFAVPTTMDPEEMAERVESLETKVETNRIALAQHESDSTRHLGNKGDRDQ